jgi:hypothetical protein
MRLMNLPSRERPRWRREIPEPKAVLLAMGGGRGA